jgi:Virulence-associated protein E/VirE N-terminal domain
MDAKLNTFHETTKKNVVEKENNSLTINELDPVLQAAKTPTNLPVPYGAERLNLPVNIYKGVKAKKGEKTTLKAFFAMLQDGNLLSISTSESLKTAYLTYKETGNKEPYNKIKNDLKGVVLGDYSTRTDNDCTVYHGLLGMDIDGYNDGLEMIWDLETLKKNPYVFAAFPSPSGHGLRVFIWTDSTFETHKATYKSLLAYLSDWLNVTTDKDKNPHLDPSTSNPCRLWFFTHTTDVYLNLDSQVYTPSVYATEPQTTATPAKSDVKKPHTNDRALNETEKIEACIEMVKAFNINTGRNNFVYNVACKCVEHGVTSDAILNHCMTAYAAEDFTKDEIKKTVNSAVKRVQFGKYTDAQLFKYLKNGDPSVPGPDTTKTATPSVSKAKTAKIEPQTSDPVNDATDADDFADDFEDAYNYASKDSPTIDHIEYYIEQRGKLRYNHVANELEFKKNNNGEFKILNKSDIHRQLLKKGMKNLKEALEVLFTSSYVPRYNPINEYFNSLPTWDETQKNHISELANYVKSPEQFWFNEQFKKMLVRVVACAVGQIPFNKHCFTLVGKQNDGKTSFVRFLCPPRLKHYIKEGMKTDKDGLFALCQNLIINLDELATIEKSDLNSIKTCFTIDHVKERPPYGAKPERFERVASFFASTNDEQFLSDPTGNVRWLVFKIDGIIHDNGGSRGYSQNVDIDGVWAQAYALLKSGFPFQLTADELNFSERNNNQFKKTYAELELLQETFLPSKKGEPNAEFMTATKIKDVLEEGATTRKLSEFKTGKALTELNFERCKCYVSSEKRPQIKQSVWGYFVERI